MNRLLLTLLFAASLLGRAPQATAQAPVPTKQWDKIFGGTEADGLTALQQTSDGGYILGGYSYSGISGDKTQPSQGGRDDYWVVKLDANGTKQWDRRFGGSGSDALIALQQTRDGGYILGGSSDSPVSGDKTQASRGDQDYWVIKLTATGTKQWDRRFGGTGVEYLQALQQTSDGGYLLGGQSPSGISGDKTQPSQGVEDYWVVKLDANGTKQWDKTFGGNYIDVVMALQQTRDGGYILGGYSGSGLSGDRTQGSQGDYDYWVVKLDASGTKQWDRRFGGNSGDIPYALQQTSDGGYILGGSSPSGLGGDKTQPGWGGTGIYTDSDYWVVKIDANGTKQWDRRFGGTGFERLFSLQQTSDGGYVLGGTSTSGIEGDRTQASQGNQDYWVVKIDAAGTKQWDKALGGSGLDEGQVVQQTRDGGYILGGSSNSPSSDDKTQPSRGLLDYWIVKLGPDSLAPPTSPSLALSAYPNPARTEFTLSGPLGTPYQLLNQLGQVVRAGQLSAQPLDVQALTAGLYLLRDQTTGHTTKLVKE